MTPDRARRATTLLAVAITSALTTRGVRRISAAGHLPGGGDRWQRTNHAGDPVTLVEGVALAVGTALPLVAVDPPAALAVVGTGLAGAADDLAGSDGSKGLGGHLRALARGEVTTGALKIALLTGSGLLAVARSDRGAGRALGPATLTGGALVAGAANLANLFDLRPGRALKVSLAAALPWALVGNPTATAVTAAGLSVLPDDLAGRSMLGDTGANPLGAAVGLAAAQTLGPRGRLVALAAVTGLVLASERVSFSAVIARHPLLRRLDDWGRRP